MYRKHLKQQQEMAEQQQVISRVSNYPLVKDTWSKVSEVYQRGKDGSRIIRFCGGVAETSASLAYMASQPVLDKLPGKVYYEMYHTLITQITYHNPST